MEKREGLAVDCIICRCRSCSPVMLKGEYKLVKCGECGVVFVCPLPSEEEVRQLYVGSGYYYGGGRLGYTGGYRNAARVQRAQFERILRTLGPPAGTGRLVEVGCAEGHLLDLARARGWGAYGVELSPFAASRARKEFGLAVYEGEVESLSVPNGFFSVAILLDVLEHVRDPRGLLCRLNALLAESGLLVIRTPDLGSRLARRQGVRWTQIKPPEHLVYFDRRSLAGVLVLCGFAIEKSDSIGGMGMVAVLRRSGLLGSSLVQGVVNTLRTDKYVPQISWYLGGLMGRHDSMLVFARKVTDM